MFQPSICIDAGKILCVNGTMIKVLCIKEQSGVEEKPAQKRKVCPVWSRTKGLLIFK